jgi:hypothetical protein
MNRDLNRRLTKLEAGVNRVTRPVVSSWPVTDDGWLPDGSVDPLWQAPAEPAHVMTEAEWEATFCDPRRALGWANKGTGKRLALNEH